MDDRNTERARHQGGEAPITETREEARQGETTAPMQRVLVAGIALVVIGFVLAYLFVFS